MPAMPTLPSADWPLVAVVGGVLALLLLAGRVPILRRLVQLAVWGVLIWLLATALGERGRFDPAFGRLTAWLDRDAQRVTGDEVRVRLGRDGHFWVRATIDGVPRRLLVDSGATVTALSARTAAAAGLEVTRPLVPVVLRTANGTVAAETAEVGELRFGPIVARGLQVVVSPAFGDTDVLGMNFLSLLKGWRVEDGVLVLQPHHPRPAAG